MSSRITVRFLAFSLALSCCVSALAAVSQQAPVVDEWRDDFAGDTLDEARWEIFTFEGGGGKVEVKNQFLSRRGD